jgi:hypothetical protein
MHISYLTIFFNHYFIKEIIRLAHNFLHETGQIYAILIYWQSKVLKKKEVSF